MSEPLSSRGLRFVLNSLLLVSTSLTARKLLNGEHPCALAACVVGGTTAVLGIVRVVFGSGVDDNEFRMLRDVSQGVLELVPLPLVNMELYMHTLGVCPLVLAHGIFIVPLLLDLRCSIAKDRKNCDVSDTMRDLTMLGNIISLGFLACMQRNFLYMRMTIIMFVVKYAPMLLDSAQDETGEDMLIFGSALFFHMLRNAAAFQAD